MQQQSIVAAVTSSNQRSKYVKASPSDDDDDDNAKEITPGSRKTQAHVTAEWNMMAGEWDDIAKEYRRKFLPLLSDLVDIKGKVLVDFGCGTGMLTEYLQRHAAHVICIDAASEMIHIVQDKVMAGDWKNVETHHAVLADAGKVNGQARRLLLQWRGKVDVVLASLVMCHLPLDDVSSTMSAIGELLKPGEGIFLHSDWETTQDETNQFRDGYTRERALTLYETANLETKDMKVLTAQIGGEDISVLVGVAMKKQSSCNMCSHHA